jgi:hypothetical protein
MGGQIRLYGMDSPEKDQDFGTRAKHAISILVFAKVVAVEPVTADRCGREVAFVRAGGYSGNGGSDPVGACRRRDQRGRSWMEAWHRQMCWVWDDR